MFRKKSTQLLPKREIFTQCDASSALLLNHSLLYLEVPHHQCCTHQDNMKDIKWVFLSTNPPHYPLQPTFSSPPLSRFPVVTSDVSPNTCWGPHCYMRATLTARVCAFLPHNLTLSLKDIISMWNLDYKYKHIHKPSRSHTPRQPLSANHTQMFMGFSTN